MLNIEERPPRAEESAKELLNEAGDDPWDKNCIEGVLRSVVHSLDSQGQYEDSLQGKDRRVTDKPAVVYAPALILRRQSAKGLTEALTRIKERIENGEEVPVEFARLAEVPSRERDDMDDRLKETAAEFAEEIFFLKHANEEQRQIKSTEQPECWSGTARQENRILLQLTLFATPPPSRYRKTPALQVLEGCPRRIAAALYQPARQRCGKRGPWVQRQRYSSEEEW